MTSPIHAAVWLDHQEARIIHVDLDSFDASRVDSPTRHVHRHAKGAAEAHEHPSDQAHFFAEVARGLKGAEKILVLGPSTAKLQLLRWMHEHDRALEAKIVGMETVDHPSDGQVVAYVKRYFGVSDPRIAR